MANLLEIMFIYGRETVNYEVTIIILAKSTYFYELIANY